MHLKNRLTKREISIAAHTVLFLIAIAVFLCLQACDCKDNSLNFSLINSRSPAINALGTNNIQAATGFEGGGHLEADIPLTP